MKYAFLAFASLWFLSGCSSSADALHVEHEKMLDFSMANSKKIEIVNSKTSKTYVTMTYLSPISHDAIDKETEKFIVGIYTATGDNEGPVVTLSNFKVNGSSEDVKVVALEKTEPLLKLISNTNPWTQYFLVEAPYTEKIKMNLSFESDRSQKVSAVFQKDY